MLEPGLKILSGCTGGIRLWVCFTWLPGQEPTPKAKPEGCEQYSYFEHEAEVVLSTLFMGLLSSPIYACSCLQKTLPNLYCSQ